MLLEVRTWLAPGQCAFVKAIHECAVQFPSRRERLHRRPQRVQNARYVLVRHISLVVARQLGNVHQVEPPRARIVHVPHDVVQAHAARVEVDRWHSVGRHLRKGHFHVAVREARRVRGRVVRRGRRRDGAVGERVERVPAAVAGDRHLKGPDRHLDRQHVRRDHRLAVAAIYTQRHRRFVDARRSVARRHKPHPQRRGLGGVAGYAVLPLQLHRRQQHIR